MKTVGSYEMKTHFSRILKEVAAGESVLVTLHGVPVARLSPVTGPDRQEVRRALDELREFRRERIVDADDIRRWIGSGRH